jgi:hypothetical protein
LARAAYEKAIAQPDTPADAWRELGYLKSRDGDTAGARADLTTYLAKAPGAPDRLLVESDVKGMGAAMSRSVITRRHLLAGGGGVIRRGLRDIRRGHGRLQGRAEFFDHAWRQMGRYFHLAWRSRPWRAAVDDRWAIPQSALCRGRVEAWPIAVAPRAAAIVRTRPIVRR